MPRPRKQFAAEEKVSIPRRHFLEKIPISTVCQCAGIQPSLFYQWQKQFFENGVASFQSSSRAGTTRTKTASPRWEAKLRKKGEVLAELMGEHVALKKVLGNSEGRLGPARHAGSGGPSKRNS